MNMIATYVPQDRPSQDDAPVPSSSCLSPSGVLAHVVLLGVLCLHARYTVSARVLSAPSAYAA